MHELKCPNCGSTFHVDQEMFRSIAEQVRSAEFDYELTRRAEEIKEKLANSYNIEQLKVREAHQSELNRLSRAIDEKSAEINMLHEKLASAAELGKAEAAKLLAKREAEIQALKESVQRTAENARMEADKRLAEASAAQLERLAEKDRIISRLETTVANNDNNRRIAILEEQSRAADRLKAKDEKIAELTHLMDSSLREKDREIAAIKEQHALVVSEKDREIQFHKDFKLRMSTKMVGETLEIHCHRLFLQAQSMGMFPFATFEKDNDIKKSGTKGDFIFRDYFDNEEYISIMFEMKNEADATQARHKNEDFLEKLDRDRNTKECEYAVLVSMLERDNELYNDGIVNMSHRYPKMYVIRPQMFMPLIALLCQASGKNRHEIVELRRQLAVAQAQSVDISRFEQRRDQFVLNFGKLVKAHLSKQDEAVDHIDKVIEALEKQIQALRQVKDTFGVSQKKLLKANEAVEKDFTIKKLTHGSPALRKEFDMIREAQQRSMLENSTASEEESADE